jgi:hypothetical protein
MTTATADHDGQPDESVLFGIPGQPADDQPEQPEVPARSDVVHAAGAVLYQAKALIYRDLLDCGPGVARAIEDLFTAMQTPTRKLRVLAAAMGVVDVVNDTVNDRALIDANPRSMADGPNELYPRDELAPVVRHPHSERCRQFLGSVELLDFHIRLMESETQ